MYVVSCGTRTNLAADAVFAVAVVPAAGLLQCAQPNLERYHNACTKKNSRAHGSSNKTFNKILQLPR